MGEGCVCADDDFDTWLEDFGCRASSDRDVYRQIDDDLESFRDVDVARSFETAKKMFRPGSSSFCRYAILNNGKNEIIRIAAKLGCLLILHISNLSMIQTTNHGFDSWQKTHEPLMKLTLKWIPVLFTNFGPLFLFCIISCFVRIYFSD